MLILVEPNGILNQTDIISYLLQYGWAVLIPYFILNPEKAEKWAYLIFKVMYYLTHKGFKKVSEANIQSKLNSYAKSLRGQVIGLDVEGVKLKWITGDDKEQSFFKDDKLRG